MSSLNRIPDLAGESREDMQQWFGMMDRLDLIYHPEDPATEIVHIDSGMPFFSTEEAIKADSVMQRLFALHGNDALDTACPYFMQRLGIPDPHQQ